MDVRVLDHQQVLSILPDRKPDSHKGDYGKILLLCGSRGYTGAAALATRGALRCGAGLVYLGVPECIYAIEAVKVTEPVLIPLPDYNGCLDSASVDLVLNRLPDMDAVLIGPGLGQTEGTADVVRAVAQNYRGPLVLDADGINVISQHMDVIRDRTSPTILTPHPGEFRRLGGNIEEDRILAAKAMARQLRSIVVLKGNKTVITDGIVCYRNLTGNPGMAVGGSGDVLAGMITALLGQGIQPMDAAACAAWLHGAAGDLCAAELGQYPMLPTDMLNALPRLLK